MAYVAVRFSTTATLFFIQTHVTDKHPGCFVRLYDHLAYASKSLVGLDTETDLLSQMILRFSPPFTHIDIVLPAVEKGRLLPLDKENSWRRIMVSHGNMGDHGIHVADLDESPLKVGQGYLLLHCTDHEVREMWRYLDHIRNHETYCSLTTLQMLSMWLRYKTTPSCLLECVLQPPHHLRKGWHCSELALYLMQKAGIFTEYINGSLLPPSELFLLMFHSGRKTLRPPYKFFSSDAADLWNNNMQIPPPLLNEENSLAVAYFSSLVPAEVNSEINSV